MTRASILSSAGWPTARALVPAVLALAVLAGCQAPIESGLPEAQANDVLVALDQHGIHALKEAERGSGEEATFAVLVAPDDVAAALAVLRAEDLPHRPDPGLHEIFGEGSLVPTPTEERARMTAALGGELAVSIEQIDGVLDARVHVALPESSELLLDQAAPRPRASVLVRYRGDSQPYQDDAIRRLVAGAIQHMDPADVAIIGVPSALAPSSTTHLTSLGPIAVSRGSATTLKLILGAMLGTNVVLALGLAFLVMRRRRPPAEPEPAGKS